MKNQLMTGLRLAVALTVLTGLAYPGVVTGLCQVLFSGQANGSLVRKDGRVIGSALVGQGFSRAEYFHPRPSAAGAEGYDATASGGSNLGPTSKALAERVEASVAELKKENPGHRGAVPADLVTTSGSGLDPHISPESAALQMERVAAARRVEKRKVSALVVEFTEARDLGFLGEPRVNVLLLNLALDRACPLPE